MVGSNPKTMKCYKEMRKTIDELEEAPQHDGQPELKEDGELIPPNGRTVPPLDLISRNGLVDAGGNPLWPSAITETQRPSAVTIMQPGADHENVASNVVPGKLTQDDLHIKVKLAKIAMGKIARWKRIRRQEVREPQAAGETKQGE